MKQVLLTTIFCLFFVLVGFSQDPENKSQQLNQQMTVLYQQGKLDEAIPIAEQIVKIQREDQFAKPQNLINALENLAQVKLARFKLESSELNSPDLNLNDAKTISEKMHKDAKDAEDNFREALRFSETGSKGATDQTIGIENNLAWLLYNFFPSDPNLTVGFDKTNRDKFDSLNKTRFYKRIDEAERLYLDALKSAETISGSESEIALLSLFNLAEFNLAMGNFEEAIPRYEKCTAAVEKKYGKISRNLLQPLESYMKVLAATDQEDSAFDVMSRIVRITGKSMKMPQTLMNISLRADKAFVSSNAPAVEQKAMANKERAELSGRTSVILSGAGLEGVQATSTFGKSYYENSKGVKVMRIAVRVVVDENGKVIEAEGLTTEKENKIEAEKIVKEWKFHPFVVNGKPKKVKGYVECLFLAEQFTK